jgi:hypothetical protein
MNGRRIPVLTLVSILSVAAGLWVGCGSSSPSGPSNGSAGGGSHNAGRNCLQCHNGGSEAPTWTLAGTVYRSDGVTANPAATVRLTRGPDGTGGVVLTLTTDGSGNFYTASSVDFGAGLFPEVSGSDGVRVSMPTTVPNGACNSCHDSSNRIRAN